MTDSSPTKSASFSPETWYRKAYEESRSASRPVPEGAGSMPGSSGTPSPGSGISSPGSFSGSPVTVSPGISTGSPGSLGGSPGFGTGSPASGSGSSPGSERGIWCENCNARLVELKRQALKLLIPGPYSSKVLNHLRIFRNHFLTCNASYRFQIAYQCWRVIVLNNSVVAVRNFGYSYSNILDRLSMSRNQNLRFKACFFYWIFFLSCITIDRFVTLS